MKAKYILSIDIGTSSCKVVLFDSSGSIIQVCSKEHRTFFKRNGGAEQNPDEWWAGICYAVKQVIESAGVGAEEIEVIGVDSQSSSMIPMDLSGNVLYPSMIWTDRRAAEEKQWVDDNIGQETITRINGNHNDESNVALKLMWLKKHEPDVYREADVIMNAAGYLVYRLTGQFTCNISEGGLTQMFDTRKGAWSDELIRAYGLDREKLPDILPCYEIAGRLTEEAAHGLGLMEGIRVAAGSMDAVACALGCGVVENGDSYITGGTVTAMGICSDRPVGNDSVHVYHHIVPGTWCNMAGVDFGGGNFRWYRDQFMQGYSEAEVYERMNHLAALIPAGSDKLLFLPTLVGQRCPQWDSTTRGVYLGITPEHTQGHFIRALMEGNAFAIREILELEKEAGAVCSQIAIAGGIARSGLWMRIFSDVLGVPLYRTECEEAAAVGNMYTAAYGVGMISSFKDVKKRIAAQRIERDEKDSRVYEKLYPIYKTLYPAVKKQFQMLADLDI
ncbi:MAG: FGGY family carbohydrate kinase [Muricomes sp.]|nr:FGGY family carbohydrate kinase [Muricomes sp.]